MSKTVTIEEIKASTGIQASIKRLLDTLEEQDLKPVALTKWARSVFNEGRKLGHDNDDIAEWVRVYAEARYYSERQIYSVLSANDVESGYKPRGGSSGGGSGRGSGLGNLIPTFTRLVLDATELDETDIIRADYSPTRITKLAEGNLKEWVSRMDESDLKVNMKWGKIHVAILERGLELIEQKMRRPRIER